MSDTLMILPAGDAGAIRLVRVPDDFESHEAYRHVTGLVAAVEESDPGCNSDDILASLEDHGFDVHHTPFGWSLKWTMGVEGHGYAKTFKSL